MTIALRWVLAAFLLVPCALAQNDAVQSSAASEAQYTVQKGDTAYSIARRYGLSLEQLLKLNALPGSSVMLGQVLTVRNSSKLVQVETASSAATTITTTLEMPLIRVQAPRWPVATLSASSVAIASQTPQIVAPAAKINPSTAAPKAVERKATSGSSHTVQKGDTAYSIAKKYGLGLERLLLLNNLSSAQVELGQVLRVREDKTPASPEQTSKVPTSSAPAWGISPWMQVYRVQKGDTLFSISRRFGVTVSALQEANGLGSSDLHRDLDLTIPAVPTAPALEAAPLEPASDPLTPPDTTQDSGWHVKAMSLLGVPYVFGGKSVRGTDCSGFTLQVMATMGVTLPRRSSDQFAQGDAVAREDLQAGDLVFFDTTGSGNVSHVGIYLGEGKFINANSYLERVAVDDLNSSYWTPRYLGARRVLLVSVARAG